MHAIQKIEILKAEKINRSKKFAPNGIKTTWQHGSDGQNFIGAVVITTGNDHFGQLGVERKLSHHRAQLSELTIIVERGQVIQQLKSSHQGLGSCKKMK